MTWWRSLEASRTDAPGDGIDEFADRFRPIDPALISDNREDIA